MTFDIALSENADLIVTGSRDLSGVSGDPLIEQRIKIRLKIERGSWVLDDSGNLGSLLSAHLGDPLPRFVSLLPDLIRSALLDMDDIQIGGIQIVDSDPRKDMDLDTSQILAIISYSHVTEAGIAPVTDELSGGTAFVPVGTGGGG